MDLSPRSLLERLAKAGDPVPPPDEIPAEPTPASVKASVPVPPVRGGARMPDWRTAPTPIAELLGEGESETDFVKVPAEDDLDDLDLDDEDQGDEDQGDEDQGDEDQGDESRKRSRFRPRWNPQGQREYRRPAYGHLPRPKESIVGSWTSMRAPTRWGLYNGAALGIGFFIGLPQLVTAQTTYLVTTYHSWTGGYVIVSYVIAAGVIWIDVKTRKWIWLFSIVGRVPLSSLIVGVLLYGPTTTLT